MEKDELLNEVLNVQIPFNKSRIERTLTVVALIATLDSAMFIFLWDGWRIFSFCFLISIICSLMYLLVATEAITKITSSYIRIGSKLPYNMEELSSEKGFRRLMEIQTSESKKFLNISEAEDIIASKMGKCRRFFRRIVGFNLLLFVFLFAILIFQEINGFLKLI